MQKGAAGAQALFMWGFHRLYLSCEGHGVTSRLPAVLRSAIWEDAICGGHDNLKRLWPWACSGVGGMYFVAGSCSGQ